MKRINKTLATMLVVPAFVLAGCSQSDNSVATQSGVAQTSDGAYVQVADTLNKSYEEAKSNGYTGTYEDWVKLLELHQTNPQQAAQQAASNGFDGMDMLMAGAMGMMLGNMMSNGSYNSYRSSSYYDDDRKRRAAGGASYVYKPRSTMSSTTATRSQSATTSRSTVSRSTVSRGGFGGARSTGG